MNPFKTLLLTAAIAATLPLTSCLDEDSAVNQLEETEVYSECFNVVQDIVTGEVTITEQPKYTLIYRYDYQNGRTYVTLQITNLRLGSIPYQSFSLPELPMTVTDNFYEPATASAVDLRPTNSTDAASAVIFSSLNLKVTRRLIVTSTGESAYLPVYSLTFVVNNTYRVGVMPLNQVYFAETETTNLASGASFTSLEPSYFIAYDPAKMTANIDIRGARFVEQMPSMNMTFPNIPFTATPLALSLAAEELTPEIGGRPMPDFPITDLRGEIKPAESASLQFNCTPATMGGAAFRVSATMTDYDMDPDANTEN